MTHVVEIICDVVARERNAAMEPVRQEFSHSFVEHVEEVIVIRLYRRDQKFEPRKSLSCQRNENSQLRQIPELARNELAGR